MRYQIIYLNGPSSAGKTTLARLLQEALSNPFLHIGIDKVIAMMPSKLNHWREGGPAEGFSWKEVLDETGRPMQEIQLGPFAQKMQVALREMALTLAKLGHFLIIDDVTFQKGDFEAWQKVLKDYSVLWVGVHSALEHLEKRERYRGDRMLGSSRAQYYRIHEGASYDLECDTSTTFLDTIVQTIKEKVEQPK
jgi:chloramphenicol 3-O phosphotransferase